MENRHRLLSGWMINLERNSLELQKEVHEKSIRYSKPIYHWTAISRVYWHIGWKANHFHVLLFLCCWRCLKRLYISNELCPCSLSPSPSSPHPSLKKTHFHISMTLEVYHFSAAIHLTMYLIVKWHQNPSPYVDPNNMIIPWTKWAIKLLIPIKCSFCQTYTYNITPIRCHPSIESRFAFVRVWWKLRPFCWNCCCHCCRCCWCGYFFFFEQPVAFE